MRSANAWGSDIVDTIRALGALAQACRIERVRNAHESCNSLCCEALERPLHPLCCFSRVPRRGLPQRAVARDGAEKWHDLIDVDAGGIATGAASIEDVGWQIFRMMLEVASGRKKTWAEHWGLHNALSLFNPGPVT